MRRRRLPGLSIHSKGNVMMNFDKLVAMIRQAVKANGSWREKRDAILNECNDEDRAAIEEFAAWFEEEAS
jgi:hypothetical protein